MKYSIIIFVTLLFACGNSTNDELIVIDKDTIYIDSEVDKYDYLGQIPDKLLTSEQAELTKTLDEVTVNYMSVKDNRLNFDLSKEQFVEKGIPERFYYLLMKNIEENLEIPQL